MEKCFFLSKSVISVSRLLVQHNEVHTCCWKGFLSASFSVRVGCSVVWVFIFFSVTSWEQRSRQNNKWLPILEEKQKLVFWSISWRMLRFDCNLGEVLYFCQKNWGENVYFKSRLHTSGLLSWLIGHWSFWVNFIIQARWGGLYSLLNPLQWSLFHSIFYRYQGILCVKTHKEVWSLSVSLISKQKNFRGDLSWPVCSLLPENSS